MERKQKQKEKDNIYFHHYTEGKIFSKPNQKQVIIRYTSVEIYENPFHLNYSCMNAC